jgi:sulfite exporter TauE/SafE
MAGFGLGTIPALFSLSYFSGWIRPNWRQMLQKLSPVVISLTALLLILRGLNLGIPYISPQYNPRKKEIHSCCRKSKSCH